MNTPINDGGPEFPQENRINGLGGYELGHPGMTLRDYFAGQALQGMIGSCVTDNACKTLIPACWIIADNMIAQREAKK